VEEENEKGEIELTKFHMVMTAIDDNPLSKSICLECRAKGVLVNIADVPPMCDFYFAAQFRRGPLQVMLSTGGMGPRIGALVRDRVEKSLPKRSKKEGTRSWRSIRSEKDGLDEEYQ
jgi:precorrin-2 dehydrogenase/sirohydrochlorin ferrochelatase